jgi:protein-L-isoaspartate(D-aspartate) O-methyltransferase
MADLALQRKNMVESQVRPSDVTDRRIMAAMAQLPRERFVPEGLEALAYMDEALPVSAGRAMLSPRTLARLIQLSGPEAGEKVLIAGALTGYTAALVDQLGCNVVALESDAMLAASCETTLKSLSAGNVRVVTGPLTQGYAPGAPYDLIFIEGGVEQVPENLVLQLSPSGRLVMIDVSGPVGQAVVMQKVAAATLARRVAFEASGGLLTGFERPKAFVF